MPTNIPNSELGQLGTYLFLARVQQGFTQKQLAVLAGITQPRLSRIEKGEVTPTFPQLIRLARALTVPLQWFLNCSTVPGAELPDIALELQSLGVVDLLVSKLVVPGAFRPTEEVLALTVSADYPDPRIIEALPAVLAWNSWSHTLLKAYCQRYDPRAATRLAWLADVTLTIHRNEGFPGGCRQRLDLEAFVRWWSKHRKLPFRADDLGRPAEGDELSPVWNRWRIRYDAPLSAFVARAHHLESLREQRRSRSEQPTRPAHE